ncbi:MAG TPA: hypothetical protein VGJ25_15335 [Gaiellaceae bacterium]|jgi:hypothetical protein
MPRLATLLACAAAALSAAVTAASAAAPVQIQLPVVGLGLPGQPPLVSRSSGAQGFYLGKLSVRERVVVDVDRGGAPTTVRVVHRIALRGKGDYRLVVPGPIDDLAPFPGEEREPGLRLDSLLWTGFSPGRRVLGAIAHLRLGDSAPYLPLRLALMTRGTVVELRIENRTTARFPALVADPRPEDVARVLDGLRASLREARNFTDLTVPAPQAGREESFSVAAAFAVRGTLAAGTRRTPFAAVVGRPHTVRLTGVAPGAVPRVELTATPIPVPDALRPRRAPTWREAVRAGTLSGSDLIRLADQALLQIELTRKYNAFLEPPSRLAPTTTTYVYRTAAARPPVAAAPASGGGSGALVPVLAGVLGVLGAGALAVLWAHS